MKGATLANYCEFKDFITNLTDGCELKTIIKKPIENNNEEINDEKVKEIISAHKGLQKQYEQEIKDNEILLEQAKKQNSISEKFKNEWKGIAKNAADSILKFTSINFIFKINR